MPLFTRDQQKAEAEAQAKAEKEFAESPVGRARAAATAGDRFFQVAIPLSETERTFGGVIGGDKNAIKTTGRDHHEALAAIEDEGWHLEHAGYIFQETGSVSRDKFLSSGQTASVTGRVLGVYLFRSTR